MVNSISIIICSYNPSEIIFKRVLDATDKAMQLYPLSEVIIVDNNSSKPIEQIEYVNAFINKPGNRKIIREPDPGLTSARIAGYKASVNPWIVFFDDDNEPCNNYLSNLNGLIGAHPDVVCWGAGKIKVEYVGKPEDEWMKKIKPYFQERSMDAICVFNKPEWNSSMPYGTGMAIKKNILSEYIYRVENKTYTLSDRLGKSLSSGGDIQIIFTAIVTGNKVGTSPTLSLTHLINSEKATLNYLCRLCYGTASSYVMAFNQVFIDDAFDISGTTNYAVLKLIFVVARATKKQDGFKRLMLNLSGRMGEINARYVCDATMQKPILLSLFERIIKY